MIACFSHHEKRQHEADGDECDGRIKGIESQPLPRRDPAGQQRRAGHRGVSGELVEAHREPAPVAAHQIDLHDDRRRPGQPLADAQEGVRHENPVPRGRPHQEERHRHRDDPAGDEHVSPADSVRQPAGGVVRQRLGHAEDDNERERGEPGGQVKFALGEKRENGALDADHRADEGVDDYQQGELREVFAKTQLDSWLVRREHCRPHGVATVS